MSSIAPSTIGVDGRRPSLTLGSAVAYLPLWYFFLPSTLAQAPVGEIALQAVYQGVLVVFVAMLLYVFAVRQLGAQTVALLMAFVPPASRRWPPCPSSASRCRC